MEHEGNMWFAIIYVIGMGGGFILAAIKKGKWWAEKSGEDNLLPYKDIFGDDSYSKSEYIPVMMVLLWWLAFIVLLVTCLVKALLFCSDKLVIAIEYASERIANFKVNKKKIHSVIREGYRTPGAKPCVACGAHTSNMQE